MNSFDDEKSPPQYDKLEVVELDSTDVGDVFAEGPRLLDLGGDGTERPIGEHFPFCHEERLDLTAIVETDEDYATRLIPRRRSFASSLHLSYVVLVAGLSCFSFVRFLSPFIHWFTWLAVLG